MHLFPNSATSDMQLIASHAVKHIMLTVSDSEHTSSNYPPFYILIISQNKEFWRFQSNTMYNYNDLLSDSNRKI